MTVQWQKRNHFLVRKLVVLRALDQSVKYQRHAMRFPENKRIISVFDDEITLIMRMSSSDRWQIQAAPYNG